MKSFTKSLHLSRESHLEVTQDVIHDTQENVERFWREIQEIGIGQISWGKDSNGFVLDIVVLDELLLVTTSLQLEIQLEILMCRNNTCICSIFQFYLDKTKGGP